MGKKRTDGINIATLIISAFYAIFQEVMNHEKREWWMNGGRGSTKSSFISLCIVLLIITFPNTNALVIRRYGNTLRESVFAQMLWAIDALGVSDYFTDSITPMRIIYKPTGQQIVFKGMDNPQKVKGTKFRKGYCAIVWWEELDEISGWADVRSVRQSLMRGGDRFWWFYSYNPPRSARSWVNERKELMRKRDNVTVSDSSYLDVITEHLDWLGPDFVEEAEQLKAEDELAYRHEYLGEPVGNGTDVFDRVVFREITDEEIAAFDNPRLGQDFGWYPDPWHFTVSEWQQAQRTLLTWHEERGNKLQPNEQAERILAFMDAHAEAFGIHLHTETVRSDDADPASINAQKSEGVQARKADKGGMRDMSYKWMQSVTWVIDPVRCPHLAAEVRAKEYEVKNDEVLNSIPDGNDHGIDATRYAVMDIVKRYREAYKK